MKIAISSTGINIDSLLDMKYGRCEFFQIHDSKSGNFKVVENKAQLLDVGAGIAVSQQLIDEKINVIITGNLDLDAFKIIKKAEIKPYRCGNISIKSVLKKFNNDELKEIELAEPTHNGVD